MSRESTFSDNPTDDVREGAADFATQTKEKAREWATAASETAGRQRENAAKGLHRAASAIEDNAGRLGTGKASQVARKVAGGMNSTASYLEEHDLSDMGKDAMDICRRHPAEAIIASLAIGFLVGRALKR